MAPLVVNGHDGAEEGAPTNLPLTEYTTDPAVAPPTSSPAFASSVPEDSRLPDGYPDYLRLILTSSVYDVVESTPLVRMNNMSNRLESNVLLKREDLLPVFSFKLRGAYNKMAHLSPKERWRGVIACSAGNHAQGVAYSARKLKIPATIVMPSGTPAIKHQNVARLGGVVKLFGADFDSAKAEAQRLEKQHGLTNIPPFDDPYVIAGQGTIGLEISRQTNLQDLEVVFCCVGGGGLIAGIGVYLKRIAPHIKIIGVEARDANAMRQSLDQGKRILLNEVGLFADGAAVKIVGEETFRICRNVVDEIIEVTTDETCAATKDVFEDTRSVVEPAGALAIAGLKKYVERYPSQKRNRGLVAIASGANMNFDRLRFVADRAALGEHKEALIMVRIPERPGAYLRLISAVLPQDVTEFSYRYGSGDKANVLMGLTVDSSRRTLEMEDLFARLGHDGMEAVDLSDDEFAKTHLRFMVGGRSDVADEKLFMFTFPERPGALFKFLTTMRPGRDITLFHYRSDGGDVARVLAGIQCPDDARDELQEFLEQLGYPFIDCTDNPTYQAFLRA